MSRCERRIYQELHVGAVGVPLDFRIVDAAGAPVPLATWLFAELIIVDPDGDRRALLADALTDGSDGWFRAITDVGDIAKIGDHFIQGHVVTSLQDFTSEIRIWEVGRTL